MIEYLYNRYSKKCRFSKKFKFNTDGSYIIFTMKENFNVKVGDHMLPKLDLLLHKEQILICRNLTKTEFYEFKKHVSNKLFKIYYVNHLK